MTWIDGARGDTEHLLMQTCPTELYPLRANLPGWPVKVLVHTLDPVISGLLAGAHDPWTAGCC